MTANTSVFRWLMLVVTCITISFRAIVTILVRISWLYIFGSICKLFSIVTLNTSEHWGSFRWFPIPVTISATNSCIFMGFA